MRGRRGHYGRQLPPVGQIVYVPRRARHKGNNWNTVPSRITHRSLSKMIRLGLGRYVHAFVPRTPHAGHLGSGPLGPSKEGGS